MGLFSRLLYLEQLQTPLLHKKERKDNIIMVGLKEKREESKTLVNKHHFIYLQIVIIKNT